MLFDLFQLDTDPYQYPKIAGAEDYLLEAAQADNPPSGTFYDPNHAIASVRLPSLGVFEHWNNPVDRKYSRNLSTGNGIELVFIEGAASGAIRPANLSEIGPSAYALRPLSRTSMVELSMPKRDWVKVVMYDGRGRMAGIALEAFMSAGRHRIDLFPAAIKNKALTKGFYLMFLY